MTNQEAHEQAAGMPLDPRFFELNGIDPDAEATGEPILSGEYMQYLELAKKLNLHTPVSEFIVVQKWLERWKKYVSGVVAEMGFTICEFGPHESDTCEGCEKADLQLYFQGPTDAGRYLCLDCIIEEHIHNQQDMKEIELLEKEGHTNHCGCRQVWGDGECECELKGIVPGTVSRKILEATL